MGDLFCKAAAKQALQRVRDPLARIFGDVQFGAMRRLGTESIILHMRGLFRSQLGSVLVTFDFENAFNSIHRCEVLKAVNHYGLCDLYNIVTFLYGQPSPLWVDEAPGLQSVDGVRQGDPLGSALFCLGIHPTLLALIGRHPDVHVRAYCDDITAFGPPHLVTKFAADLEATFLVIGLKLRHDKCAVLTHFDAQFAAFAGTNFRHDRDSTRVLGAVIAATDNIESAWIVTKVPRMQAFFDKLVLLNRQCAYGLFRW
jgi:hypothetical protein